MNQWGLWLLKKLSNYKISDATKNIFINNKIEYEKILIIEDDLWILNSLDALFIKSEFEVVTCENWLSAMEIFLESKPELIILDINLPWKNWIEICRENKRNW